MKIAQIIASVLLGGLFLFAGLFFFFGTLPPPPPTDTVMGMFSAAFMDTGYMHFVKVLEVLGAALLLIPRTRVLGLLILSPIIVNIVAFHVFITEGAGLVGAPLLAAFLAIFLIWSHRRGVAALLSDRG